MGKRYDWQVTPQNTPRFKQRRILFLLAMGIFVLNLLCAAFLLAENNAWESFFAMEFGFFSVVHCFSERRVEMQTWGYVIFWIVFSFVGSAAVFLWHKAYWWFIGYGVELVVFALTAVLLFKRKTRKFAGYRKLYLCPVWKCDHLDSFLSSMEKEGYRLVGTSWFGLMYFQKSAPKTVRYFCTYPCLKNLSMNGIENELRSKYRANPIPTGIGTRQIHRITDIDANLTELNELRRKSLLRVILERLFFAVLLPIAVVVIAFSVHMDALLWIAVTALFIFIVYYLAGIVSLYRKR